MALTATTRAPLLPRAAWFVAGAALAAASILVYSEVVDGGDASSVAPTPGPAPVQVEDDPLFTRYGDVSAAGGAPTPEVDIEDDPLVARYGDR